MVQIECARWTLVDTCVYVSKAFNRDQMAAVYTTICVHKIYGKI